MKNIKRTERVHGKTKGHRFGINGNELLDYFTARMRIYLPTYKYVLDNCAHSLVMKIAERAKGHDIVFLDYNTNIDVRNTSSPLSHAGLVKLYIEGNYPSADQQLLPMSAEEIKTARQTRKAKRQGSGRIKSSNRQIELTLF